MYRGERANLEVLAEEIAADPVLGRHCTVRFEAAGPADQGSLRHDAWAEIAIAIATGIATSAIYDSLRLLVSRARDRGKVSEVKPASESDDRPASESGSESTR
ncbi:hypothetical protein GCM10022205_40720 [Spinactinospora alkalitolerans]